MKNVLHRRKLLTEIKSLLARRRSERRMLQGMFKVTEWRQIDVIDWLHYDVKLPMYTEHFIEAELDGRTLRDGVTSTILKLDMGIEQKRHRRKIMGCISKLRTGEPLASPTIKRTMMGMRKDGNGGNGGNDGNGGNNGDLLGGGLLRMDGQGPNYSSSGVSEDEEEAELIREEFDIRQNARLLQNIRVQVEAELKGISHGEQLLDMSNTDLNAVAWEFGLESPTAKSLRLGKNPTLPNGPEEVDIIASQSAGETGKEEHNNNIPTLHLKDSDEDRGPPFVVPRHSQVSEMISVINVLAKQQLRKLINPRIPSLSSLAVVLWTQMLDNMDKDTAKREGGITFQEFPTSLFGTLNLSIRNQMQVLLLFRAMDVDGDGVISKEDCKNALPRDPESQTSR